MKNKAKSKKGIQPKLRFPDFIDKIGWQEVILSNVLTEHKLKNDGESKVHSVSVHKGIINQIEHLGRSFAASDTSKYNLVKPFDIVYTKSPTGDFPFGIVKQNRLDHNVIVSPLYGVFSPLNKYLGYILDCYFESPIRTKNYLDPITQKGAKNTIQIPNDIFLSRGVYLPDNEEEQQKIADCLLSLDELIEIEDKNLEVLQRYKKGLMQELFPSEGKTLPKRRFPEFRNYPKWEETPISAIGDIITGSTPSTNQRKFYGGKWQFVSPVDIGDGRYIEATKTTLSEEGFAEIRPVKANSILFVCIGSTIGKVAQNIKKCATNQQINSIVPNTNYYNAFVYFILDWHAKQIAELAGNQTIPIINKSTFGAIKIRIPKLAEQQRIADFLTSIDDLITTKTKKLESLSLHKKGLMQQLFLNISEVEE